MLGAAMLGGAVHAGRRTQEAQYREQEQEQRLQELEQQQPVVAPAQPPVAPAPAAAPGGAALVDQLKQLNDLKSSGALSAEEFEAAKQKLLAS